MNNYFNLPECYIDDEDFINKVNDYQFDIFTGLLKIGSTVSAEDRIKHLATVGKKHIDFETFLINYINSKFGDKE